MGKDDLVESILRKSTLKWGYTERPIPIFYQQYLKWIEEKKHLPLDYLGGKGARIRADLKSYFPPFKSALVFLFPYVESKAKQLQNQNQIPPKNHLKLGSYVLAFEGIDYHQYVGEKLEEISNQIREVMPSVEITPSVDAQPIMEKDLALRAGLGWSGKNSLLFDQDYGSYFVIGALLLSETLNFNIDFDLDKKRPMVDRCGSCRKCIDACPTGAIFENDYNLMVKKCLSAYTVEKFKGFAPPLGSEGCLEFFGCDICQDVCPWNQKALDLREGVEGVEVVEGEKYKLIVDFFLDRPVQDILNRLTAMSNRQFKKMFKGTSFERAGREKLINNIKNLCVVTTGKNFRVK